MNCVRCGGDIPFGSPACPNCGLKLKPAPRPQVPARGPGGPGAQAAGPPAVPGPQPPAAGGYAPQAGTVPQGQPPAGEPAGGGIPEGPPLVGEIPPPQAMQPAPGPPIGTGPPTSMGPDVDRAPGGHNFYIPSAPNQDMYIPSAPEPGGPLSSQAEPYVPGQIRPELRGISKPMDEDGSYGVPAGDVGGYDIHQPPPGHFVPEAADELPQAIPYPAPGAQAPGPYVSPSDASAAVGYPPQGAPYPPPGAPYPPQAGAFPPQAGAYPPQAGAYPPPGAGYQVPGAAPALPAPAVKAPRARPAMSRSTLVVIMVAVASLVIVAGAAAVYFLVLNKKAATPQEQVVIKYFEALNKGDTATLQSLLAPGQQYTDQELMVVKAIMSPGMLKFENPELETSSVSGTDATVLMKSITITVDVGGQKSSRKTGTSGDSFYLKNVSGKWMLLKKGAALLDLTIPGMPGQ
ncbi:MAG: hypothetical protein KKF41_00470 [Actinobacteria bacterium]|nr:hypothetical protein [Actinomycetota bacterium]MBU1942720.1 hypothetical protein [Actinomycetota bacterium]MBU2686042.1 hypothetical protein [Actinomycetota bacterium]